MMACSQCDLSDEKMAVKKQSTTLGLDAESMFNSISYNDLELHPARSQFKNSQLEMLCTDEDFFSQQGQIEEQATPELGAKELVSDL